MSEPSCCSSVSAGCAKEVLRFAGIFALHHEELIYEREVQELRAQWLEGTSSIGSASLSHTATLFWGVGANHAFRDGNKRTAAVLLRSFLNLNGFDKTLNEDEIFKPALESLTPI